MGFERYNALSDMKLRTMMRLLSILLLVFFGVAQVFFLFTINYNNTISRRAYLEQRCAQLKNQTDILFNNITTIANTLAYNNMVQKYAQSGPIQEALTAYTRIGILMDAVAMANADISSIFLTDFDTAHLGNVDYTTFDIKRGLTLEMEKMGWPERQLIVTLEGDEEKQLVCVTPSFERQGRRLYIVLNFNLNNFREMFNLSDAQEGWALLDQDNQTIYANEHMPEAWTGTLVEAAQDGAAAGNAGLLVVKSESTSLGWRWVIGETDGNLWMQNQGLITFTLLLDTLLVVLLFIFLWLHDRNVIRPIGRIVDFLNENHAGQKKGRLTLFSRNEIGQIAYAINRTLENMERADEEARLAQQNVYDLKIAQQQTELSALQSQINPHFLYNTLECVRGIAMVRDVPEILDISTYMADIFRYSIKGSGFVRLAQEMEIIREYIGIMQIRQNNRYQVSIEIPDELMGVNIPRMILQPIVENAVFHGLERVRRTPRLSIAGRLNAGHLEIEVTDNGAGMDENAFAALKAALRDAERGGAGLEKKCVGLVNINNRIRLTCGVGYGLTIRSCEDLGTAVLVTLPSDRIN